MKDIKVIALLTNNSLLCQGMYKFGLVLLFS